MRFVDEFREPELITKTAEEIRRLADPARHYRFMEVCGGHTHAIYRFGLKDLLPENIELVHGPGCPVCVLPMGRIDDGLSIAAQPEPYLRGFGDMMRVPGTQRQSARTQSARRGRAHRLLARRRAAASRKQNPEQARHVFCHRIRDHRALDRADADARASARASAIFRSSAITSRSFPPSARFSIRRTCASTDSSVRATSRPSSAAAPTNGSRSNEDKPIVVSGFEPLDMLQSIVMLLRQLRRGEAKVENQYKRVVPWEGNRAGAEGHGGGLRAASVFRMARPRDSSRNRPCASATRTPNGMPSALFTSPASASPIPKRRSAAKCSRAC